MENIRLLREKKYMTVTIFSVHNDGRFVHAGAHQDILIYRAAEALVETVETSGTWIGFMDDIKNMVSDSTLCLSPWDVMLLYTDGIAEAERTGNNNEHLKFYGNEQLVQILRSQGKAAPGKIREVLITNLEGYTCPDDVAFIIIKQL